MIDRSILAYAHSFVAYLHQVLVFVSSKQGCEDLCKSLNQHTSLQAGAIHGDRDQTDRQEERADGGMPAVETSCRRCFVRCNGRV